MGHHLRLRGVRLGSSDDCGLCPMWTLSARSDLPVPAPLPPSLRDWMSGRPHQAVVHRTLFVLDHFGRLLRPICHKQGPFYLFPIRVLFPFPFFLSLPLSLSLFMSNGDTPLHPNSNMLRIRTIDFRICERERMILEHPCRCLIAIARDQQQQVPFLSFRFLHQLPTKSHPSSKFTSSGR